MSRLKKCEATGLQRLFDPGSRFCGECVHGAGPCFARARPFFLEVGRFGSPPQDGPRFGTAGADRTGGGRWAGEQGDCGAGGCRREHGRQMASALCRASARRPLRRTALRGSAHDRRSADRRIIASPWNRRRRMPMRALRYGPSASPLLRVRRSWVLGWCCVWTRRARSVSLDRTQPLLPMRPGQVERRTHDYIRHGTTTLFAALDIATGKVIGQCFPRHRAGVPQIPAHSHPPTSTRFHPSRIRSRSGTVHRSRRNSNRPFGTTSTPSTPTRDPSDGPNPPTTSWPQSNASACVPSIPQNGRGKSSKLQNRDTRARPFFLEPPTMPMRALRYPASPLLRVRGGFRAAKNPPHPEQAPLGFARDRLRAVSRDATAALPPKSDTL